MNQPEISSYDGEGNDHQALPVYIKYEQGLLETGLLETAHYRQVTFRLRL